jgi:hypothetical protein
MSHGGRDGGVRDIKGLAGGVSGLVRIGGWRAGWGASIGIAYVEETPLQVQGDRIRISREILGESTRARLNIQSPLQRTRQL